MTPDFFLSAENALFTPAMALYLLSMVLYILFLVLGRERLGRFGGYSALLGFVLHTCALIVRTIGAGRLPLSNQYEFATSFAWGIALCYLLFLSRFRFRALGAFVLPIVFLVIGYAAMQSREVRALMPALQSSWLAIHVLSAIVSYGAFAVSFGVSLLYLFRESRLLKDRIPSVDMLDLLSYRAVALGFLFLTFVMVSGAIWAEHAWGSYWSWDPKETWSLVTWIIYAVYLHLRLTRNWQGKGPALFAAIGFICVIFTYIGVNTLLPGIHSYA